MIRGLVSPVASHARFLSFFTRHVESTDFLNRRRERYRFLPFHESVKHTMSRVTTKTNASERYAIKKLGNDEALPVGLKSSARKEREEISMIFAKHMEVKECAK